MNDQRSNQAARAEDASGLTGQVYGRVGDAEPETKVGKRVRAIAFYLPQFHPIPENDQWWGKGFTEWTNVAKARPLFQGHYQPRIPADLGFYDLRVPEARMAQAELASEHGIEGFCYWHYWFAGRRLLERPLNEVLQSGEPRSPFCLGWANETWTGIWHGAPNKILVEQTYPGAEDYERHFYCLLDALTDPRYITVEGRPIVVIYRPFGIPDARRFTDLWRELALKAGLKGLFLMGIGEPEDQLDLLGFDAKIIECLWRAYGMTSRWIQPESRASRYWSRLAAYAKHRRRVRPARVLVYRYADVMKHANFEPQDDPFEIPCVYPGWDNTARSGYRGVVLHDATVEAFGSHLRTAVGQVMHREPERRFVFVKSWNEWAEGNYLEPDLRFGRSFLEVTRNELTLP